MQTCLAKFPSSLVKPHRPHQVPPSPHRKPRHCATSRSNICNYKVLAVTAPFTSASTACPVTYKGRASSVVAHASSQPMATQEVAIVGGGCFWCVEAVYNMMQGVNSALSGYAGGHDPNPTYEKVCAKNTGHAEVVQIKYDPSIIDYRTILRVFFTVHDPTTKDRQGNDVGPQYRSIIMYTNEEQKQVAEEVMKEVSDEKIFSAPLVTELVPATTFHEAEKYHQRYYEQNPNQGYCSFVVGPKVAKFRAKWSKLLR